MKKIIGNIIEFIIWMNKPMLLTRKEASELGVDIFATKIYTNTHKPLERF